MMKEKSSRVGQFVVIRDGVPLLKRPTEVYTDGWYSVLHSGEYRTIRGAIRGAKKAHGNPEWLRK